MNQWVGEMKCWICAAEASSGEHLLKESTLKELFGEVSQKKLLYHSSARKKNKHLQSTNSGLLKLCVLCAQCNSSRTQQSDFAWDAFIAYLNKNGSSLNTGAVIRFSRAFGYQAKEKMLNLHLYFMKLFGCVAAGKSIPVDISGMSDSIMRKQPYPNIYVGLGKRDYLKSLVFAGPSDVHTVMDGDKCVFAVWFLTFGEWEFQLIYALPGQKRDGMVNTWNPIRGRRIHLKEFLK